MASVQLSTAIVINTTYGGFSLSRNACEAIAGLKQGHYDAEQGEFVLGDQRIYVRDLARNDPAMVAVVREFGAAASAEGSKLVVEDISITIEIADHDGKESVRVR